MLSDGLVARDSFSCGSSFERIRRVLLRCAMGMALVCGVVAVTSTRAVAQAGAAAEGRPAMTLMPSSVNFASMAAGAVSPAQSVTVTNTGTAPLHISDVQMPGFTLPDFGFYSGCVRPVLPGGTCLISVTFVPREVGQRMAQIVVRDDAPDSPQTISLSGNALVPYSISGAMTATITAGQTAQYNLQIRSEPGFLGTVQLQCSGRPSGTSCIVTPSTVFVGAVSEPTTFVVQVTTTAAGGPTPVTPPGTYMLIIAANWSTLSPKATVTLVVQ